MSKVVIDLGAIRRNLDRIAKWVAPARVWAVVKADAYGHGAGPTAQALEGHSALRGLAVARTQEARDLQRLGVRCPILILSPTFQGEDYCWAASAGVEVVISSQVQIEVVRSVAPRLSRPLRVHLELDTGMTRLGFALKDAIAVVRDGFDSSMPIDICGWMSHLAAAEDPGRPETMEQLQRFKASLDLLTPERLAQLEVHLANSAAALLMPEARFHCVRVGLALYGIQPFSGRSPVLLEPAMTVQSAIALIQDIPTGRSVGYGCRWRAERPSKIAIVPVGYGDGYAWSLGNRSWALVAGARVPVVGSVSMDLLALDVSGLEVAAGTEVVLLGEQGEEEITIHDLATWAGTIPYELLCRLGRRLPRCYLAAADVALPESEACIVPTAVETP